MEELYFVYLKWCALPQADKKPKTKTEFAERYEITPADLLSFEDRETFGEDLMVELKKWAKRKTPELAHLLYDKYVKTKSPQDFKIWLDFVKETKQDGEEPKTVNNIVNIFNPNEEQRKQIADRITRRGIALPAGSQE